MNEENEIVLQNTESGVSAGSVVEQYNEVLERLEQINLQLDEMLEEESEEQDEEVTEELTEEVTEEQTEEIEEQELIFLDDFVDAHLYLSSKVENADLNDLYSIGLSIRNVLLLFVLIVVFWKLYRLLKSAIYKVFNL